MSSFEAFCETVRMLRDPVAGCPWDIKQTHRSLCKYMLEEAYEAVDVMSQELDEDPAKKQELIDELGDVLLQVVLNAQIACDQNRFSIEDVIHSINAKMRRRHPHVFDRKNASELSEQDVRLQWQEIKDLEKKVSATKLAQQIATVSKSFPATIQGQKLGRIAEKLKFDWSTPFEVFSQLKSEIREVAEILDESKVNNQEQMSSNEALNEGLRERLLDEVGDVYFTLAQLCRHLGFDSEVAARMGNRKFARRLAKMEEIALANGQTLESRDQKELELLWKEVKSLE